MKKLTMFLLILNGFLSLRLNAQPIKVSTSSGDSLDPHLEISTISKEIFIVWQDKRAGTSGLYFRRFSSAGTPQTAEVRFSAAGTKPVLAVGTDSKVRVAWLTGSTVYFAILSDQGTVIAGPKAVENNCWQPSIALGPDNEANLVYEQRWLFSYYVIFTRFDALGKGPVCRVKLDNGDILGDWRKQPEVWSDAFGSSAIFFTDRRGWDRTMCLGLINPAQAGKPCPLDPSQWIFCGADRVVSPTVAFYPPDAKQIFYFWQERFGGRDRILTLDCQPIDDSSKNARAPKAVCAATQIASLVWQDDRDGNWEIYLGQVSAEGKLIASQRLTNTMADSLNPDITLINEKPIIVWQEKEADGFEIYLQGEFLPPPETQLKIYDFETDFWQDLQPPYANFNSALPTVVIVHGWNPDCFETLNDATPWIELASAIYQRENGKINILGWDWLEEARNGDGSCGINLTQVPGHKIGDQAVRIASKLVSLFSAVSYSKNYKIHLMGHSLGAYLIVYCGEQLIRPQNGSYNVSQITMWDPPHQNFIGVSDICTAVEYMRKNSNCYVELYDGAANFFKHRVNLWVDVPVNLLEHLVYKWYIPTARNELVPLVYDSNDNPIVGTVGYNTTRESVRPDAACQGLCPDDLQTLVVNYAFGHFKIDKKCGSCFCEVPGVKENWSIQESVFEGKGSGNIEDNSTINLWTALAKKGKVGDDNFVVSCIFPVTITDQWDYVSFNYQFKNEVLAVLTFYVKSGEDAIPLFTASTNSLNIGQWQNSRLLPIAQFQNQNVQFVFELKSELAGAEISISNLQLSQDVAHFNQAPIAKAGNNAVCQANEAGMAMVNLSGVSSFDPDGDELWYSWRLNYIFLADSTEASVELPVGIHTIKLSVADKYETYATDEVIIKVEFPFIRGDCNSDKAIDIGDAIVTLAHLFLEQSVDCQNACDSNDSGEIELADAIYILNFIFVGGSLPPSPFLTPGIDLTFDTLGCEN